MMNPEYWNNYSSMMTNGWNSSILGGMIGALIVFGILLMVLILAALYVYHSLAWLTIARKMKFKKAWLSWIPLANESMRLYIGKLHWAWIFLALIPFFGWAAVIVLVTIATWRIFERLGYSGWLALSFALMFIPGVNMLGFIAYFVIIGIVAWRKK